MCHGGMYPDLFAHVIGNLKPGDEIMVEPGFGHPQLANKRKLVVAAVNGYSAVTTDGTGLMCSDGSGVVPTGEKKAVSEIVTIVTVLFPRRCPALLRFINGNGDWPPVIQHYK